MLLEEAHIQDHHIVAVVFDLGIPNPWHPYMNTSVEVKVLYTLSMKGVLDTSGPKSAFNILPIDQNILQKLFCLQHH